MKLTDKGGSRREPAPEGTHTARCFAVIDLGTQASEWQGRTKHARKLLLGFELPEEKHVFDEAKGEEPFTVWSRYTASLHEKSQLRPLLESWRGRAFTEQELAGFEIKNLVGAPAMLSVVHERGYANITGIAKLPKGLQCPPAIIPSVYLSLDDGEFDAKVYEGLSDKLKETISQSPEYKEATGNHSAPKPASEVEDDDIPFN